MKSHPRMPAKLGESIIGTASKAWEGAGKEDIQSIISGATVFFALNFVKINIEKNISSKKWVPTIRVGRTV